MRVLIADDSQVSRALLEQQLTGLGFELELASNGEEAWEKLQAEDGPDLALLDWMMPGMEGVDVCRRVREVASDRYRYLILITMKERPEDVATGLAAGADDFITKPFEPAELEARIRVGERVLRFAERLRRANNDLARLATTDELTRLYNRGAILDRFDQEAGRATREGRELSVLMIDVDNFKPTNDNFGHAAGDAVLRLTAEAIEGGVRLYDTVGRYGGDEFLVVLPGATTEQARVVAERVRERVDKSTIATGTERLHATVSIGIASWHPNAGNDGNRAEYVPLASSVIRAADAALYVAKANGRNNVHAAEAAEYAHARAALTE